MAKNLTHKDHLKATGGYDNLVSNDKSFRAQYKLRKVEYWKKADRAQLSESRTNIFNIVMIILLAFAIFGVMRNEEMLTFNGLLELFQNAPTINLDWLNWSSINLGDWGVFNFLRDVIDFLLDFVNLLAFAGTMIFQLLMYVLYFLKALLL